MIRGFGFRLSFKRFRYQGRHSNGRWRFIPAGVLSAALYIGVSYAANHDERILREIFLSKDGLIEAARVSAKSSDHDIYTRTPPSKDEMQRVVSTLRPLRIGFVGSKPKYDKLIEAMKSSMKKHNITMCYISDDEWSPSNLDVVRSYDIILQKSFRLDADCMDNLNCFSLSKRSKGSNKGTLVIDDPRKVENVKNRGKHAALCEIGLNQNPDCKFEFARSFVVDTFDEHNFSSNDNIVQWLKEKFLEFPLLYKPMGSGNDHETICLVFTPQGLVSACNMHMPALIQRYVPHTGQIYKVYVMGDEAMITQRTSIPEITAEIKNSFNKEGKNWHFGRVSSSTIHHSSIEQSTTSDLVELGNQLRKIFDVRMFNADVVLDHDSGKLVVVDVNYLPGYQKCFEDFGDRFLRFLAEEYNKY
mmetsp:Transcript_1375/g.1946  ORF Transcript_1375/g.1946 Transcript_1375/m.1946 type:complete len:416 (-) Transcript_1375:83-1330(-)